MRMMLLLLVSALLATTSSLQAADHTTDTLETVKKNLAAKKAVLLDVREKNEWEQGHLTQARLIPLSELAAGKKSFKLPKDKILYLHCRSGGRALPAADILREQGYDARPLRFGFKALVEKGFQPAKKK